MKILITGSHGQLGRELCGALKGVAKAEIVATDLDTLDICDTKAVEAFLRQGGFTHVVNCAAYTAVDRAEEFKAECAAVNIAGIENIARLADELDLRIIHISTDYIFDGTACRPYTESSKPNPLNVYGSTKRRGETALLGLAPSATIVRTGWLHSPYGHNFVKTILERGAKGQRLEVVADQIGTPTYASDLADAIVDILTAPTWTPGIYNYSDAGVASWYDFAVAVLESAGLHDAAAAVIPIASSDYPSPATRPAYAVLDKSRIRATFGVKVPHWQLSLRKCMARILAAANGELSNSR